MMKRNRLIQVATLMVPLILFSLSSLAQTTTIHGEVTDENGDALLGVNVVIKGTTRGTVTDGDGKYALEAESDEILVFSFIGYLPDEITVGTQEEINISLVPDITGLEEVVVVGYGTVKKSDLTGAVSSVKSEKLMATAPTTIQNALKGKAAGVVITSGVTVNSTPSIRIRGNRSIGASNDPLFVVDGFPLTGGYESINPSDIESIEILKDASATAIYGSRGANGVILVTTKKGEAGKIVVQYDSYFSIGKLDRFRKAMDVGEYTELVREGNRQYEYDGVGGYTLSPTSRYGSLEPNYEQDLTMGYFTQDPYLTESLNRGWASGVWNPSAARSFNWQMAGFRDNATSQSHNLSVRGGTEKTKYYISGSFLKQRDLELQSYRKRYNLHLNLDQNVGNIVDMGGNIDYSFLDWNDGKGIPIFWNPLGTPYNSPNDDVTLDGDPAYGLIPHPCGEPLQVNSFYDLDGVVKENKMNNVIANIYATVNFLKGFSYRVNFGSSLNVKQEQEFYSHFSTETGLGDPKAKQSIWFDRGWSFENILAYKTKIKAHSIDVTAVQTNEKFVSEPVTLEGNQLPFEHQLWYDLNAAPQQTTTSDYTQWTMMSWLGRINYSLLDRYLLTASIRYDGSSRLAKGHEWVAFPSVALGWRISEENFLKNSTIVTNLKLRLGYGVTGNSAVDPYQTEGQIQSSRYNWAKTEGVLGYEPYTLANKALSWETTEQYNIGLDFGFIKGRIAGAIDIYKQRTYDLLMNSTLPPISGFRYIIDNVGETQNKGIEISLNTTNIHTNKFMWTTDITFAANKEEITKLVSGLEEDYGNDWYVGYPIDTYRDYVAAPIVWGYSQEDMEEMARFAENSQRFAPGDLRVMDLNNDYYISDLDRTIRGSKMPKWTASMSNTFSYGPFDLYVFMYGAFGHVIYWDPGIGLGGRYNTYHVDYWTPTNTNTKWLAPHSDLQMPSNITAMYYWKGDFVKISDITLGYTLPNSLTTRVKIQKLRLYFKIQNPFTFTKYEGIDPEGAIAEPRDEDGQLDTYDETPFTMRIYMFGLNVTL